MSLPRMVCDGVMYLPDANMHIIVQGFPCDLIEVSEDGAATRMDGAYYPMDHLDNYRVTQDGQTWIDWQVFDPMRKPPRVKVTT